MESNKALWWENLVEGWGVPLSVMGREDCQWPLPSEVDGAIVGLERLLEAERNGD